ncbi:MAG: tetratricopeptide repeat protein [Clostridia bacterium]|nr:tetratricopeptide repeat protein [Clostridia bacterium]
MLMQVYTNIGAAHLKDGNYSEAKHYPEKALHLNGLYSERIIYVARCLIDLAICEQNLGNLDQARDYAWDAAVILIPTHIDDDSSGMHQELQSLFSLLQTIEFERNPEFKKRYLKASKEEATTHLQQVLQTLRCQSAGQADPGSRFQEVEVSGHYPAERVLCRQNHGGRVHSVDGGLLSQQKTKSIKNPSCMNISVHTGGISSCVIIVGILMTVSKQYQICFEMPPLPVFTGKNGGCSLFPLAYQIYLWCLQVANKGHFPAVLAINCA